MKRSESEVEQIVLTHMREVYPQRPITSATTFRELHDSVDSDVSSVHSLIEIEATLGVELPDEEVLMLDRGSVKDLIDLIMRRLT